ncbi:hypothetical protein Anas_09940 [Armadillidium nasatum]|uniref:Uncharacterized protein n=1 Tax=Armadillidium nasatum TaxID=96803 RepID=A0A5N5TAW8_9CRUS|nr:hypothetical protein Anas_09940 [Armadillidium nasatum]
MSFDYRSDIYLLSTALDVKLDGKKVEFIKPKIPRWYTVSHFHEVAVSFQGNIVEFKCSYNNSKKPNDVLPISSGLQIFTSSTKKTLIEDVEIKETFSLSPVTSSKPENLKIKSESNVSTNETSFHNNITEQVNKMVNESFFNTEIKETNKLPLTTVSISVNKTVDEKEHASESPEQVTNLINISIEIPNATLDRQGNLLPTILPDLNYSNFENGPPESSQSCLNGNCEEGQYSHNYIVALCLFGILGAMVLIAIVISVVFHRKKKKLMISSRARPNNRLRQQIFEKEIAAENQLMLRQMEHTYEELP